MTSGEWLAQTTKQLAAGGITTARLDCLVLLEDVLSQGRAHILAHPEVELSRPQISQLNNFVTQREAHTPLAYIRGHVAFYGRDFAVNQHVLVPRPETEAMIDFVKDLPLKPGALLADIGTGSGCIGITAALELPQTTVWLYDIDPAALNVARQNAQQLRARVHTGVSDLLHNVSEHFDVLFANLPYVPDDYAINQAAEHEPKLALFSGTDGLDLFRTFWQQVAARRDKPTYILTECLLEQQPALIELAQKAGYHRAASQLLIQLFELSPTA